MVSIRPATSQDMDGMVELLRQLFSIEADFAFNEERQRRGLALLLSNPRCCLLVAADQGRVVGMCSGQVVISTAEGGPSLLVEDVVVHTDWRGQGLGRRLLEELEDWATLRNIGRLQMLADRNNDQALGFYRRLGWQKTQLICLRQYTGRCRTDQNQQQREDDK